MGSARRDWLLVIFWTLIAAAVVILVRILVG